MDRRKMFRSFGNYLKEKRIARGLTQIEVGETLGVKSQFVSNWERGMSQPPLRLLRLLVRLYGIPEKEILDFMMNEQEQFLRSQLRLSRKRG